MCANGDLAKDTSLYTLTNVNSDITIPREKQTNNNWTRWGQTGTRKDLLVILLSLSRFLVKRGCLSINRHISSGFGTWRWKSSAQDGEMCAISWCHQSPRRLSSGSHCSSNVSPQFNFTSTRGPFQEPVAGHRMKAQMRRWWWVLHGRAAYISCNRSCMWSHFSRRP